MEESNLLESEHSGNDLILLVGGSEDCLNNISCKQGIGPGANPHHEPSLGLNQTNRV